MTVGSWFFFDHWLQNMADGDSDIFADNVKAILCGNSQALGKTFVGASTDCRYADITGQIATGSGYTSGGVLLPSKTVTRVGGTVTFSSAAFGWTITAAIAGLKYCVLYDDSAVNKDLIMACDLDTGGGTVTAAPGLLSFSPGANGYGRWYQP